MAADDPVGRQDAGLRYFSRMNYMSKRIVDDEKIFIKYLGSRWNELPAQHKDALLDLLFVDDGIRDVYTGGVNNLRGVKPADDAPEIQESFPRLYINSGHKINVDFENDLWTWRDEHSGPFSWMSKSQQDLTFSNLEPDNILKPQPKSLKVDADEEKIQKVAEPQFTHPSSSWCHSVIDDFRQNEQSIVLTPSASIDLMGVTAESSVDHAGTATQVNGDAISPTSGQTHDLNQDNGVDDVDPAPESDRKSGGKDRNRKSPSPKKILRGGSLKKSQSKSSDCGEEKLIACDDQEIDDRTNAFSNPVMESEWSTFVGHSNAEDVSSSEAQESPVTHAPKSMVMDRGGYQEPNSPYAGDRTCLLQQTDSPAQASSKSVTCPDGSDWSSQSTPDHTTCLLKGIQSPVRHISAKSQPGKLSSSDMSDDADLEDTEEVLIVEREGDQIVVTTQVENKRDSDVLKSGYDFLDDW